MWKGKAGGGVEKETKIDPYRVFQFREAAIYAGLMGFFFNGKTLLFTDHLDPEVSPARSGG